MKKLTLSLLVLLASVGTVAADSVSLSTYYPAPFGAYDRLRLVPRANPPVCTAALEGLLYYDSNDNLLKVCKDPTTGFEFISGVWTQNNIDAATAEVFLTDQVRAVNVGIGTTNPQADLHITGNGELRLESADVGVTMISTGGGNDDFKLNVSNTDALEIKPGPNFNTNVMTVGSNGRVGIGVDVAPPSDNLLIDGNGSNVVHRIDIDNTGSNSAWLRLTERNFQGGFLRYDNSTNNFHIGVHDTNDKNTGNDVLAISIRRLNGNVLVGGGNFPASQQSLNINGGIMLNNGSANWGRLMLQYDTGNYYAVYAP